MKMVPKAITMPIAAVMSHSGKWWPKTVSWHWTVIVISFSS